MKWWPYLAAGFFAGLLASVMLPAYFDAPVFVLLGLACAALGAAYLSRGK